jgi:hypothetical protein
MRKFILIFLISILCFAVIFSQNVKIPVATFPVDSSAVWEDNVSSILFNLLETQSSKAKRFTLITNDLIKESSTEKEFSMIRVSKNDALSTGKLFGAQYVLVLELIKFDTVFDSSKNSFRNDGKVFVELYDLNDETLVTSKQISFYDLGVNNNQAELNSIRSLVIDLMWFLEESFPQYANVSFVDGNKIVLEGIDPKTVKKGNVFKNSDESKFGYLFVEDITEVTVIGKLRYGEIFEGDKLVEVPFFPLWMSLGLSSSLMNGEIINGLNLNVLSSFYNSKIQLTADFDFILSNPISAKFLLGLSNNILINKITISPLFAANLIYILNPEGFNLIGDEEIFNIDFGLSLGAKGIYELNYNLGFGGSALYNLQFGKHVPSNLSFNINLFYRF